jgi:hypothetical protein
MTLNYSLQLTEQINELMRSNLLGLFRTYYPTAKIKEMKRINSRDRVYTDEATLLAMLLTAVQQDKSQQNSVNIYAEIHKNNIPNIIDRRNEAIAIEKEKDKFAKRRPGKPKAYKPRIAKSKLQEISTNTGSFTTAKQRLDIKLVRMVYADSANFANIEIKNKWKGMNVVITDGTYLQMQDSKELRELYDVKSDSTQYKSGYPQGLLQVLIEQGSGAVVQFELGNRHVSELELVTKMVPKIKRGTLILADDLYNTYAIFSLVKKYGLEIIVPGKRTRNYTVKRKIAKGDEIVEIKKTEHPAWLSKEEKLPEVILMRRLTFESPLNPGALYVIYTTILDEKISKTDIVAKYFSRWDIEISIREIKTMMDINVIRSKKSDLVIKELMTALIAYNLIRKIIAKATENSSFFPKSDIIQKYLEAGKTILIDKKGRIYSRWSPGRYGNANEKNITAQSSSEAR